MFLFSEILIKSRDKLREAETFIITLQKDRVKEDKTKKRINVKKIISIDELIDEPYSNVTIELNENFKINEISEILSKPGNTSVNLIINEKNKIAQYSLQNNRKFDLNHLKALKAKEYVIKITV